MTLPLDMLHTTLSGKIYFNICIIFNAYSLDV